MSNGFVSYKLAKPTRSGVYPVRYVAKTLHDPDDPGHECDGFAYWDNGLKRWGRPSLGINQAFLASKTAAFFYHSRQDLDWKPERVN